MHTRTHRALPLGFVSRSRKGLQALALLLLPGFGLPPFAPELAAQTGTAGSITGIVWDAEDEEGEPQAGMPINLATSTGTSRVATTGPTGQATMPYTASVPAGTQVGVYLVSIAGVTGLMLLPEGVSSGECDDDDQNQGRCTPLGVIYWGQTQSASVRLGTVPQFIAAVAGGPLAQKLFLAGTVARNLEFEAFKLGVEVGTALLPNALLGGPLLASVAFGRMGISNGATLWQTTALLSTLLPGPSALLSWRAGAGLLMNYQSSEFASGSEFGAAFRAGVVYGLGQRAAITADLGVDRIRGQTQFVVGASYVFAPGSF